MTAPNNEIVQEPMKSGETMANRPRQRRANPRRRAGFEARSGMRLWHQPYNDFVAEDINPAYLTDASGYKGRAERVFVPGDEGEVLEVLGAARREKMPVTIAGAGSGLTGARVPQGGWVLSLEKFRGLEIGKGAARVGAAVTLVELRDRAVASRQFYAPDPTEITASVGGTVATNASGSRSFRYGSTRDHVLALRVAMMDGGVVEYRRGERIDFEAPRLPIPRTTKCTAGYRLEPGMDWIDLFCGSEGTLGVIVGAELKLLPVPEELFAGVVFFAGDDEALEAAEAWRGVSDLRMLEYVDRNSLGMLRERYSEIPGQASAALMIESEGDDVEGWETRLTEAGALMEDSWFALTPADRERFRKFRHTLPELVNALVLGRGFLKMSTDFAVPLDRSREMMTFYRARLESEMRGKYVIYGHIGDAHVHVNVLPANEGDVERGTALVMEFARKVVELGGTISAEHGLGKRKAHLLRLQYTAEEIEAMRQVKRRFDPDWLLGRGTLFEEGA
jgi:FAD/FMN-containing dehydrogenase